MKATIDAQMASSQNGHGPGGITANLFALADGVAKLIVRHLELARHELGEDARVLGALIAKLVVFVPFVLVGYTFLCAALVLWLGRFLPLDLAFLLVGGVNAIGGAVGLWYVARTLRARPLFDATLRELRSSAMVLGQARETSTWEARDGL